ncbi:hypothetical protein EFK50_05915 [Nocardioides marmoriginsengisoli]|uniref:Class F sortase n=1 Tax=Nocardioides marmoriginsengisoli TaxID=661483 RepID=A0A3N0CKW6_9ACTN|nr:hypothetical protein EFK50_05915 [Nocardioides marmoriginsengisoli]
MLIAVVVALVPALVFSVQRLLDDDPAGARTPRTELPIPSVGTPSSTPSGTPTSTPSTPAATPTRTARINTAGLPRVAPDPPRRLLSAGLLDVGFDNSVEPRNGTFRAASTAEAARWGSRGTPGNPATDTVYVIGKTNSRGVSAFDTLPRIKVGAKIVIRTDNGDLTYTVRTVGTRAASGLARNAGIAAKTPGRLILIGVRYDNAQNLTGQAVVVTADLTGAARR